MQTEQPPTKQELVEAKLASERRRLKAELDLCDSIALIMLRLPDNVIENVQITCQTMMLYGCDREQAVAIMSTLGAGRWSKALTGWDSTKINYKTTIDGVNVEIYAAPPPDSCRIIETEVYVPAHNAIKRELVCH